MNYQPFDRDKLDEMLDARDFKLFIASVDTLNPVDAADYLSTLSPERLPVVFRLLKKDTAADIFAELEPDRQSHIISGMNDREICSMMDELFTDDAVNMLEEMPAGTVKRILKLATPETRAEINKFLAYPEDSAGGVMTSEFIDLRRKMTCAEAIERIRRIGRVSETVYVAYVTDRSRVLEGVVPLKDLLYADPKGLVGEIMNPNVIFAYTHDDREKVAATISHYGLLALPVVDTERRLVGIVTVDDAMDVIESETTEDITKMAAVSPSDKPYMKITVSEAWKARIPWLVILMVCATFTGAIITHYEDAIGTYAILTAFIPMLMSMGGNAGGQTSAMVIRSLSLGEVAPRDVLRVLWKELRIAFLCGATLFAAIFIKVMLVDFRLQAYTVLEGEILQNNLVLALIIGLTAFLAVIVAKMVGTLLPLGAKRIGLDPTVMASPFITTIVDTVTLVIYFTVASLWLGF